jgi:hypothetical protein
MEGTMFDFIAKRRLLKRLRSGWTLVRYRYGYFCIEKEGCEREFIPLKIAGGLWSDGVVEAEVVFEPLRLVFRLAQ